MQQIGTKIRKIRELKNLSQEYMAEYLNISQSQYSRIEHKDSKIDLDQVEKIAQVFGMRIEDIITFDEKVIFNISNNNNNNIVKGVFYNNGFDSDLLFSQLKEKDVRIEELLNEIAKLKAKTIN